MGVGFCIETGRSLDVSDMTIRRDLTELEKVGLIRRTHGGAVNVRGRGYEPPLALRSIENKPIKERIGRYAAQLVAEGESISLDIGSTIFEVAAGLEETRNITIVTPSIPIASLFFFRSDVRLILPGGIVRPGEDLAGWRYCPTIFERNFCRPPLSWCRCSRLKSRSD